MSFGATVVVTVNAVAKTLNNIRRDDYGSEYYLREATQEFRMKIRHTREAPIKATGVVFERHNVELTQTVYSTTVGVPNIVRQAYSVFRNMSTDTLVDPGYLNVGFIDYMDSATVQGDLLAWMS